MNAPLSRFLQSFSPKDDIELAVVEPLGDELDLACEPELETEAPAEVDPTAVALEMALCGLRDELETAHAQEIARLEETHAQALDGALVAARADWATASAADVGASIEAAMAQLRDMLSERTAAVLTPLIAEAIRARALEAMERTIARILADPEHPCLTVRGPVDLLEALRARAPDAAGLIYETADGVEVTVSADGMRVETRLGHALAALEGPEPQE